MSLVNSKQLRGRTPNNSMSFTLWWSYFQLVILRPAGRIIGGGDNVLQHSSSPLLSVGLDPHAEITGEEVTVVTLQAEWRWGVWEYRASFWFHFSFHLASSVDCPFVYFMPLLLEAVFLLGFDSIPLTFHFVSPLRRNSLCYYLRSLPYQKRFLLLVFDRFLPTRNICLQTRRGTVP